MPGFRRPGYVSQECFQPLAITRAFLRQQEYFEGLWVSQVMLYIRQA